MTRKKKILTPEKAIKAKCLDCCGQQKNEVEQCNIIDCPLWPYRNGVNQFEFPLHRDSKELWETDIEMEDEDE